MRACGRFFTRGPRPRRPFLEPRRPVGRRRRGTLKVLPCGEPQRACRLAVYCTRTITPRVPRITVSLRASIAVVLSPPPQGLARPRSASTPPAKYKGMAARLSRAYTASPCRGPTPRLPVRVRRQPPNPLEAQFGGCCQCRAETGRDAGRQAPVVRTPPPPPGWRVRKRGRGRSGRLLPHCHFQAACDSEQWAR